MSRFACQKCGKDDLDIDTRVMQLAGFVNAKICVTCDNDFHDYCFDLPEFKEWTKQVVRTKALIASGVVLNSEQFNQYYEEDMQIVKAMKAKTKEWLATNPNATK